MNSTLASATGRLSQVRAYRTNSPASLAIQQLGGVVLDVAYVAADLEGFHLIGGEGTQLVYLLAARQAFLAALA